MLKMDLEPDINNIPFLQYMEEQEKEKPQEGVRAGLLEEPFYLSSCEDEKQLEK